MRAITIWHKALQSEANVWRQWYKRSSIIGAGGLSLPEYLLLAPRPSWRCTYWSCTLAHTLFHTEPAIKAQSVVPVQPWDAVVQPRFLYVPKRSLRRPRCNTHAYDPEENFSSFNLVSRQSWSKIPALTTALLSSLPALQGFMSSALRFSLCYGWALSGCCI